MLQVFYHTLQGIQWSVSRADIALRNWLRRTMLKESWERSWQSVVTSNGKDLVVAIVACRIDPVDVQVSSWSLYRTDSFLPTFLLQSHDKYHERGMECTERLKSSLSPTETHTGDGKQKAAFLGPKFEQWQESSQQGAANLGINWDFLFDWAENASNKPEALAKNSRISGKESLQRQTGVFRIWQFRFRSLTSKETRTSREKCCVSGPDKGYIPTWPLRTSYCNHQKLLTTTFTKTSILLE